MITFLALSASLDVTYVVENFQIGAIHRPDVVVRVAGGKALNAARACLTVGGSAEAIAVLGGHTGALVQELLGTSGLPLTVVASNAETRTCVSIASDDDSGLTELYEQAAPLADGLLDQVLGAVGRVDFGWLALAGSVPSGTDLRRLSTALSARRRAGLRVAIDTHGEALRILVGEVSPDLVKVNRHEAGELLGQDGSARELAEGIAHQTGGIAVVTDGIHGSAASRANEVFVVKPLAEHGRFPVGSGDAFFGGVLAGLDRNEEFKVALALAAASGAANALEPGAGMFSVSSTEKMLEKTEIR